MNDPQPNLGAPADAGNDRKQESSDSALGASAAKAAAESDGTKSPVPASVTPEPVYQQTGSQVIGEIFAPAKPIVFGGQFQDVAATETVREGETRNYVDDQGHDNEVEIVGSNLDGTVNILVPVSVGRIRRDNVPWKKEGMKMGYVE